MTPCPRCDCSRVGHLWRTDMPRLVVIDEWKCLDPQCAHRWLTSVPFVPEPEPFVDVVRHDFGPGVDHG